MTSMRTTRPSRNEYTCVTSRSASSVPSSARTSWWTATATRPSPASVGAHVVAAGHPAALEGIGPVDLGVQRGEHGVDVARVEGGVDVAQEGFVFHARVIAQLAGCVCVGDLGLP
jgi:hypothetical protein